MTDFFTASKREYIKNTSSFLTKEMALLSLFKSEYREYLKCVSSLLKRLDLSDPISVHTLLCYLYNNSYITLEDDFTNYDRATSVDYRINSEKGIAGALFLNNHGVCRNASCFEADVFKKALGFESGVVCGYMSDFNPELKRYESLRDKILKHDIRLEDEPENIHIDEFIEFIRMLVGNHAICNVTDDNYTYYLDLYNMGVFVPTEKKDNLLFDDGAILDIRKLGSLLYHNSHICKNIGSLDEDTISKISSEALELIKDSSSQLKEFREETFPILINAEDTYQRLLTCKY